MFTNGGLFRRSDEAFLVVCGVGQPSLDLKLYPGSPGGVYKPSWNPIINAMPPHNYFCTKYLVLGTKYLVLGTWYQVLGTKYEVLGTTY